jgi:hypothetical protein
MSAESSTAAQASSGERVGVALAVTLAVTVTDDDRLDVIDCVEVSVTLPDVVTVDEGVNDALAVTENVAVLLTELLPDCVLEIVHDGVTVTDVDGLLV